ncbi:MAG: response regulator [Ruthenibacterium sp.]
MHIILVGNCNATLQNLANMCRTVPQTDVDGIFTDAAAALAHVQNYATDCVFADVSMPDMDQFALCNILHEHTHELMIVLMAANSAEAAAALAKHVDGVLMQPCDAADVAHILARLHWLQARLRKRVYCHTFGRFDLFIDREPIVFQSAKAKEILALCVYRQGAPVSIEEMIDKLWENYSGIPGECSTFRTAIKALADTLKKHGCGDILVRGRGFCYIKKDAVDSDYYDFLNNNAQAICEFQGEFMSDYSWGDAAVYSLGEKKRQYEAAASKVSEK